MSRIRFLIIMLVMAVFIAGCGTKQAQDTKTPVKAQVGIIDINKVVKAHPKYNDLMVLEKQAMAIASQVEAEQAAAARQIAQISGFTPDVSSGNLDEINKAFEQEFNTKVATKQAELDAKLGAKADAVRRALADELNVYNDQLNKEYQPQIFNLQLKIKTVQITKEEMVSLQTELEKLQTQQADKMLAKQQQLVARMDELMAPEKAAIQEQLAVYAKQVNDELSQQATTKQTEIANRNKQMPIPDAAANQVSSDSQQKLVMKQQEIAAMQDFIMENVKDKAGKVAVQGGYEVVLINVAVNVNAVDITTEVIAECNK